jgi:hypothetical protein
MKIGEISESGAINMPEEIVQGHSLEEIRQEWALKLKLSPEQITLEVMEKPGFFSHQWKVRLIWEEQGARIPLLAPSQVIRDEGKYFIVMGKGVQQFRPFIQAGEVWYNGKRQDKPFRVNLGDQVEFHPNASEGQLTWVLQIPIHSLSVVAKVTHELAGHYILPESLPALAEIDLKQQAIWETLPSKGETWNEEKLKLDLAKLQVVYGFRPESWSEIISVRGVGEVIIAEATLPIPSEPAQVEDFVGRSQVHSDSAEASVDFFASKVQLVEEGTVLARKIPGKLGVPGKDVLGKVLPAAGYKDFQFILKKNVHLSADGLEVIASHAGQPIRLDERTYMVENVYIQEKDVDLATGSIQFPGDVFVNGNVLDGLRIYAGGKVEIKGSVSHAEIRAEKGLRIYQNLVGGKVVIGEKFVVRSKLLRSVSELHDQLGLCLRRTADLTNSPGAVNVKPGQCLKLMMEKQFPELSRLSNQVEELILKYKDDEMVTEGLVVTIRTAKHFLTGLGPLNPQAIPYLQRVEEVLAQFIGNMTLEIPEKLSFVVSYVQGATIECGGSMECAKGAYNSNIRVEGDITIEGVCRGGKIFAGGKVSIGELGGSGVSSTFVQISPDSRLSVKYCHPNVNITVGKEIIQIEEAYRQLEIFREKGYVQVEKLRANPL